MWRPLCCGAAVKFSHGSTQYRLSYPLQRTASETSSLHSPSITRPLFTLCLQEHGHGPHLIAIIYLSLQIYHVQRAHLNCKNMKLFMKSWTGHIRGQKQINMFSLLCLWSTILHLCQIINMLIISAEHSYSLVSWTLTSLLAADMFDRAFRDRRADVLNFLPAAYRWWWHWCMTAEALLKQGSRLGGYVK